MKLLKQLNETIILETYKNLFTSDDKQVYANDIWDMLQQSYKRIGGIKGSGFGSKQEMIDKIPMIKLGIKNKKPVMALFYKDSGGRKRVAIATDGSTEGKNMLIDALQSEAKMNRAFGEISGPSWSFLLKILSEPEIKRILIKPEQVKEILKKDITIGVGNDLKLTTNTKKYLDYYYQRNIGGAMHTKVMVGTPGLSIK